MKEAIKPSGVSLKNNRKTKVFIFFLVLTSIIWLLIELSKTYTSSAVFKVDYSNLSTDKLLQNKPVSELNIAFKAPGFNVLKYKLIRHKLILNLSNISKRNNTYYILPNHQISSLNGQLSVGTDLVRVLNDTIFIEIGNNVSKKVPVITDLEIKFKLGYNLTEKLNIIPDSVTITGPEKFVDSIKEIKTVQIKIDDIHENIDVDLALIEIDKVKNVNFSENEIKITGKVDKFTEGSFTYPVVIINEPEGVEINPFPREIEVVYQVGLSNFNKITENSISIVFDYKQYENDTLLQFLTPIIKQKSDYISSMKINPDQIEFLIQK
jgi:hypothetical protein